MGPGYLFMATGGAKLCSGTIRSALRNTVAPKCKPCEHDGLAPKNYFHGRRISAQPGIAAAMMRKIVASPSGSGALWLPRETLADRRRERVAEDRTAGTRSEVRIQTMGYRGDSAPKIISGSSRSCNTRYSYYVGYSHIT